jgi:hypothetical protein
MPEPSSTRLRARLPPGSLSVFGVLAEPPIYGINFAASTFLPIIVDRQNAAASGCRQAAVNLPRDAGLRSVDDAVDEHTLAERRLTALRTAREHGDDRNSRSSPRGIRPIEMIQVLGRPD